MENKKNFTRETFVRKFYKENRLPFPVQREEFLEYYSQVEGFENLVTEFNKYMDKVSNYGFNKYVIRAADEYQLQVPT